MSVITSRTRGRPSCVETFRAVKDPRPGDALGEESATYGGVAEPTDSLRVLPRKLALGGLV
jgi:hypothetical protein